MIFRSARSYSHYPAVRSTDLSSTSIGRPCNETSSCAPWLDSPTTGIDTLINGVVSGFLKEVTVFSAVIMSSDKPLPFVYQFAAGENTIIATPLNAQD